jgi:hypothetical protein
MKIKKWCYFIFFSLYVLCIPVTTSQDSIPTNSQSDAIQIDTTVIRSPIFKVRYIPRGVNLVNPKISYKSTKYLDKKFKRFRVPSFWERINKVGLSVSEVAFVNWNAGGNSSISGIINGKFERNYKFRYVQWDNLLDVRYGANIQEGQKPRKTDDAIRFSSTFGYRRDTISNWYYSVKANFNTQFYSGFKYPDRETPISRLMAPGYVFLGAGTSYIPEGKKFNLYISPVTLKATFVLDQELANKGSFGVQKAILDANGNVLQEGDMRFIELGFLINNTWETTVAKNVEMQHRLSLYTDYLASFGNVDIDWELNFNLIVNKYINATIGTHIIFDDDILFNEIKDAAGIVIDQGEQRIQFKQLLGVGVAYDF